MKYRNFVLSLAMFSSASAISFGANQLPDYGKLPLSFEANQGQTNGQVKFLAHGRLGQGEGYTLFLTTDEAVLALPKNPSLLGNSHKTERGAPFALRMKFLRANATPEITGVDEMGGKSNYFTGNDPKKWYTNVPTYSKVQYKSLYPGIDLVYYGNQRQLEYDFVVAPGADPQQIGFDVQGASKIGRDVNGDLVLRVGGRDIRWHKPVVYQEQDGVRREIAGRYVIQGKNRVGFELARYDRSKALIIDPTLYYSPYPIYSTYLGGPGADAGYGIAVDSAGEAYVAGESYSITGFPTKNAVQTSVGGAGNNTAAFVTKLNSSGTALVYSTYLGGELNDMATGIAVDGSGDAYLTGTTNSADFPTRNPIDPGAPHYAGNEYGFVTKLGPTGSLVYSTYLASGEVQMHAWGIAVDNTGDAYVTGDTVGNLLIKNPFQPYLAGGTDAFVTKLSATGSALVYSTYLGGSGNDVGKSIAVDSLGAAYVTGSTNSANFPTKDPFQSVNRDATGGNAFVTKLSSTGSALVYSTYLGGNGGETGNGIAVDGLGDAYVTGSTLSSDFPTKNPMQAALAGYQNAFVTKFNPTGSGLIYSTYLGSSGNAAGQGIAVDGVGDAYVTGTTGSNFPILEAFQPNYGGSGDAFLTRLDSNGELVVSSYLGGSGGDGGQGIAVGSSGTAYVTGYTSSANFLAVNAFQKSYAGGGDAFVTAIGFMSSNGSGTLRFTNTEWNFGPLVVGLGNGTGVIWVTNTGSWPVQFPINPVIAALPGLQAETTCGQASPSAVGPPTPLAPGATCAIEFRYTPQALGITHGTITLLSNAIGSPNVIPIQGNGTGVNISSSSWSFSPQAVGTTSPAGTIYLNNESPAPMNLLSTVSLQGLDPGDFALKNECSAAVAPYTTCEIKLTFTPRAANFRQAEIVITSAQVQNGSVSIPIYADAYTSAAN